MLATERDAYCDRDGEWGCASKQEFAAAVTSPGWFWEQNDWQPSKTDINVDAEGWSYGVSFDSFGASGAEYKGPAPGGGRRSSGVFVSDPRLSLNDIEMLHKMELLNAADATAIAQEGELEPLTPNEGGAGGSSSTAEAEAKQDAPPPKPAKPTPAAAADGGSGSGSGMQYTSPGAAAKSMLHFVRRRRLLRWQCFDIALVTHGVPLSRLPCSHCDLSALEDVAALLLQSLAEASIIAHPRQFNEPKCNALKARLLAALTLDCTQLMEHAEAWQAPGSPEPAGVEGALPPPPPAAEGSAAGVSGVSYSLQRLVEGLLLPFKASCSSTGASVSGLFSGGTNSEALGKRTQELAGALFPFAERRILAQAVIKVHDVPGRATGAAGATTGAAGAAIGTGYIFHCKTLSCGAGCKFAHEVCQNDGCECEYSTCHRADHVSVCQYQLCNCPRAQCTEQVPRRVLDGHVAHWCAYRPANCPFKELGCMTPLTAATVAPHLDECHASHSMLMLARMNEQQTVIKKLHKEGAEARAEATKHSVALAAAMGAIELMQAREGVDTMHEIKKLKAQVAQLEKLKDVEGALTTRMNAVSAQLHQNVETERTRVNLEFGKVAKALAARK